MSYQDREWYWKREHLWVDREGKRWVADLLYGPGNHVKEIHRKRVLGATEVWPPPQPQDPKVIAQQKAEKEAADARAGLLQGIQDALLGDNSPLDSRTREEMKRQVDWRNRVGG